MIWNISGYRLDLRTVLLNEVANQYITIITTIINNNILKILKNWTNSQ